MVRSVAFGDVGIATKEKYNPEGPIWGWKKNSICKPSESFDGNL